MTAAQERPVGGLSIKDQLRCTTIFRASQGGEIKVARVEPDRRVSSRSVVLVPAYTQQLPMMEHVATAISQMGRPSIALEYPEQGVIVNGKNPYRTDHYPHAYEKEATGLVELLRSGKETVDVVAISHGAVIAAMAAEQMDQTPDGPKIGNILLINPGCLISGDTVEELQDRTYGMLAVHGMKQEYLDEQWNSSESDPDCRLPYIAETLEKLVLNGHGIAVLLAQDDIVFPPRDIISTLQKLREGIKDNFIRVIPGGHLNFRNRFITPHVINLFTALESTTESRE